MKRHPETRFRRDLRIRSVITRVMNEHQRKAFVKALSELILELPMTVTKRLGPNEYRCAMCGGVFEKSRPDEEALKETEQLFGTQALAEPLEIVCDDCWQKTRPDHNPDVLAAYLEAREKGKEVGEA